MDQNLAFIKENGHESPRLAVAFRYFSDKRPISYRVPGFTMALPRKNVYPPATPLTAFTHGFGYDDYLLNCVPV